MVLQHGAHAAGVRLRQGQVATTNLVHRCLHAMVVLCMLLVLLLGVRDAVRGGDLAVLFDNFWRIRGTSHRPGGHTSLLTLSLRVREVRDRQAAFAAIILLMVHVARQKWSI